MCPASKIPLARAYFLLQAHLPFCPLFLEADFLQLITHRTLCPIDRLDSGSFEEIELELNRDHQLGDFVHGKLPCTHNMVRGIRGKLASALAASPFSDETEDGNDDKYKRS